MKTNSSYSHRSLWGLALLFLAWTSRTQAADHTVEITNFSFRPATLTIDAGDTVTWINKDAVQHTSTSGVGGKADGLWDSGLLSLNKSFPHTFSDPGSFRYYCTPHTFMTGTITVNAGTVALQVSITSPTNQTVFAGPTNVTVEATVTATGTTVTNVTFFDGTTSLGEDTTAPYSVTVPLAAGSHTLTAQAAGTGDRKATSSSVTVTVNTGGTGGDPGSGGKKIEDPIPAHLVKGDTTIELETVAEGLISPLGLTAPDDGSGRMFVYDQAGLVYVIANGSKLETPLLDVRDRLVALGSYDERGLLGFATHPNFAQNPLVYTYTSEANGGKADFTSSLPEGSTNDHQSVITEWRIDPANTNRIDLASRREILRIDQPQPNHNGGTLRFGPDGFLYISLGDGGGADDEGPGHGATGNGQDRENLYGTLVRINIDGRTSNNGQYAVPTDNPFVGQAGVDEIYAYGFRNPYSYSFDRLTGELYLADVGQNQVEELDRVFAGGNYGWPIKEGGFYFDQAGTNAGFVTTVPVRDVPADLVDPIAQYDHDEGTVLVAGYVYRGANIPGLIGRYLAGDWGNFAQPLGRLVYLDRTEFKQLRIGNNDRPLGLWLKGFGQDANGELYVLGSTNLGPGGTSGKVLKIVPPQPIEITGVARSSTNLALAWTDGIGPFVVQEQDEIYEDSWKPVSYPVTATVTLPIQQEVNFFRVAPVTGNSDIPFTVFMSGSAERPTPVETTATGSGTLSLAGNTLHFDIRYAGLSGAAVAAHIHGPGTSSAAAGVLIDLKPYNGGAFGTNGTLSGSVTVTPEQKAMVLSGLTYVNVHTPAHAGGEIRGQVVPVAFKASLSGDAERPQPVATLAEGAGTFLLAGNQLTFNVNYHDLSGAAVAAHIHGPAGPDEAVGVLIDLKTFAVGGFGTNGTLAGTVTLTADQLASVADGLTYVNIHTPAHAGGEIRGQILPNPSSVPLSASLSGAAERPTPVETTATGSGYFLLSGSHLQFHVNYSGLSGPAVAAHIHGPARASEAAGVSINLAPFAQGGFGANGTLAGTVSITDLQRAMLLDGRAYVNVHTAAHGGGEIRGQVSPVLLHSVLLGASERPSAVQSPGKGTGHFLLLGNQLNVQTTYAGLSSTAVAAHIHGPAAPSGATGVLIDLEPLNGGAFGTNGSLAGTVTLTPDQLAALVDGLTYVNFHTGPHAGGEIRGQIVR